MSDRFPVSAAQRRFWFLDQVAPGRADLNIAVRWEIQGELRSASLEAALQTVVGRHEILRTRFVDVDGTPMQEICPKAEIRLGLVDLRTMPADAHAARIDAIAREMAAEPFDLTRPGLLRVTLVRCEPTRAALLIAAHHTVFDGYSIRILGHELGTIAAAIETGKPWELPELPLHYADYALWQEAYEESGAWDPDAAYWQAQLTDAPYFELPPDVPQEPGRRVEGGRIEIPMPEEFDRRMAKAAAEHDVSPFTFGYAATVAALSRFTGQSDVSVGTAVAGRDEVELEGLIGVFINTLVLRTAADPDLPFSDLIARAKTTVEGALSHQSYPLDALVRLLNPPRDLNRTPLVSVSFAMQRVFLEEKRYGPFELISVPSHTPGILYDLNIHLLGRARGWALMIDYNAARFSVATMRSLAKLVAATVSLAIDDPSLRIADIPLTATPTRVVPARAPAPRRVTPLPDARETRAKLAKIWGEVLGLDPARTDGDFFDLGGYSILVLRMMAKVEAAFGVRPELAEFLAAPTLAGFATAIDRAKASAARSPAKGLWEIIPLRDGRPDGPVVVTINQTFLYHNITDCFAADRSVINLTVPDRRALAAHEAMSFDQVVAEAAMALRARYRGRPMAFAGQCVDGLIALRVAQTLQDAGETVLAVAMIDAWAPKRHGEVSPLTRRSRRLAAQIRRYGHYIGLKLRGEIGWHQLLSKNGLTARFLIALGLLPPGTDAERLLLEVNALHQHLVRGYRFPVFDGEALLFKTESQTRRANTELFGWRDTLSPDTPLYEIPGWHEDALLEHGFERLGDVFDRRIARARLSTGDAGDGHRAAM